MVTSRHLSNPPPAPQERRIQVRLVWRLLLCLFGHLTLLLVLAIYLVISLNSVRQYTPIANAVEVQVESLNTIPALLGAMDAERYAWQKNADAIAREAYLQTRIVVESNLASLNTPFLRSSDEELRRRNLIRQWITDVGDPAMAEAGGKAPNLAGVNAKSKALLDQLKALTGTVRSEVEATLKDLQNQESNETSDRVSLMWKLVGSVTFFTILIQLALSNSIIGPIQALAETVRRLQSGDYTVRAHLRSGDEIQSLGETFNAMADNILRSQRELQEKNVRLSAQQEALRNANAGLEERVAEKTDDLQRALGAELALRQELEDKNQKLNEAARLKDEFLATLSHELRTPLTPVISCAHLLGADPQIKPDQLKSVQVIERNARGLSRMIDELLDLSAVMNRKLLLEREKVELNEWTRATVETMRPAWEKKELKVTFIPAPEPVPMEIDPTRLAQVVTNLVNNAIKYTQPKGIITVQLTTSPSEVRIAVTDNGTGLNLSEIDHIFEMFHQSRTHENRGVGGLGVGLTVARAMAELHGGGLLAASPGAGLGSTFTLWLPRLKEAAPSAVHDSGPLPVDRSLLKGRRVLVVEDSTDTREALERILLRRECRVIAAPDGEKGLEEALKSPPEIILSDIGLPGMSGLDLMTQLKRRNEFKDVIAIALSGLGRDQDVEAARQAGFDAHLLKPVDINLLDKTLVEALARKLSVTNS